MNKMENINGRYSCNTCNKNYASYKSLWNHNKKFHNSNILSDSIILVNDSKLPHNTSKITQNTSIHSCKYCVKSFTRKDNLTRHEKTCKSKINEDNKIQQLENEIQKLKQEFALLVKEKGKLHHKTLQKINKQLNTTNNINNGVINNVYVKYNNISHDVLTKKEILNILSKHTKALEESIKKIHFNEKIPENNNVFITNLQNNIGYAFDGSQFVAINKGELLNDIIDVHLNEMFLSLNKYKDNIKSQTLDKINYLINMITKENKKYIDYENNSKVYKNYKDYKIDVVKMLIYNNSDKNKFDQIKKLDELFEKIENDELFDQIDEF